MHDPFYRYNLARLTGTKLDPWQTHWLRGFRRRLPELSRPGIQQGQGQLCGQT